MANSEKPVVAITKNRFNRFKLKLEDDSSYLLSEDDDADIKIPLVKASIYKDQGRWILMCIEGADLTVNEQIMSSVELRENLDIKLGGYTVMYSPQGVIKQSPSAISPIRIVIGVLALLLIVILFLPNDETVSSSHDESKITNIEPDSLQESSVTLSANKAMRPQAFEYYNDALNTYDSGDLKTALVKMLDAASIDPSNPLIQNKIEDWEGKIDAEISRLYKQACFDLEYFRYYEAESLLRIIVELSVDETDIRFTQSLKILEQMSSASQVKPVCGA